MAPFSDSLEERLSYPTKIIFFLRYPQSSAGNSLPLASQYFILRLSRRLKESVIEANSHEYVLWIMLFVYALHILEEHTLNWLDWARHVLKLDLSWADFYVTNSIVVVGGICTAMIGWQLPQISLTFPALAIVNALLFHIGPTLVQRRFSPGTITAVFLFLPVGAWSYYGAYLDDILTMRVAIVSVLGGALLMAYPIFLLRLKPRLAGHEK